LERKTISRLKSTYRQLNDREKKNIFNGKNEEDVAIMQRCRILQKIKNFPPPEENFPKNFPKLFYHQCLQTNFISTQNISKRT
jgi:hypothetical protein